MTKNDRQKLSIFIILLFVLGLTIVLGYRMNQPPTTAAVQTPEVKTSANPPAPNDARIRLDLVENPQDSDDIGKKNVFQYRQVAAPPQPKPISSSAPPAVITSPPVPPRPPQPPPPPPIPLKYQGYFAMNAPGGGLTAVLADESRHYNVTIGEVLMGRYRIASISDRSVEVEDLELNRRQALALVK